MDRGNCPKKNLRDVVGANVRRLRTACNVSQETLAEQAGFHRTYVSQVERGLANLTIDNLERLARVLGVAASVLLEDLEPLS
jgi:transcriptional regulator with XRE-family HTH domain